MSIDPAPPVPEPGTRIQGYEFSPDEDKLFHDLAAKMRLVGWVYLLVSALGIGLMVVYWIKGRPTIDLSSVVLLFVGGWTLSAARSFAKVAETHGRDVPHVLEALRDLHKLYTLLYWVILAAIFLVIFLIVLASVAR
jgi:hypothetical protein